MALLTLINISLFKLALLKNKLALFVIGINLTKTKNKMANCEMEMSSKAITKIKKEYMISSKTTLL